MHPQKTLKILIIAKEYIRNQLYISLINFHDNDILLLYLSAAIAEKTMYYNTIMEYRNISPIKKRSSIDLLPAIMAVT